MCLQYLLEWLGQRTREMYVKLSDQLCGDW